MSLRLFSFRRLQQMRYQRHLTPQKEYDQHDTTTSLFGIRVQCEYTSLNVTDRQSTLIWHHKFSIEFKQFLNSVESWEADQNCVLPRSLLMYLQIFRGYTKHKITFYSPSKRHTQGIRNCETCYFQYSMRIPQFSSSIEKCREKTFFFWFWVEKGLPVNMCVGCLWSVKCKCDSVMIKQNNANFNTLFVF